MNFKVMKIFVRLRVLLEQDDINILNKIEGLKFDRIWVKGDLRPNSKIIEKFSGCILNSGLDDTASLDKHLGALLNQLQDNESIFKKLSENNKVDICCAVYSYNIPAFYFEREIIEGIAKIGANFDIDFYFLPKD